MRRSGSGTPSAARLLVFLLAALGGGTACQSGGSPGGAGGSASGSGGRGSGGTPGAAGTTGVAGAAGDAGPGTGGSGGRDAAVVGVPDAAPSDGALRDDLARTDASGDTRSSDAGSADADASSVQELIHYYGRWNRLTDRAITVNSGSQVSATFSGAAISARFDVTLNQLPNPTLAWRIDQQDWQEAELAATLPLATGLSGTHQVLLMVRSLNEQQSRWTPPLVSSITFLGFAVTGGAVQPSERPARPRIEFLGDSITEGVNVWPARPGKDTVCWREDGRLGFASQTAQALGAEWRQVGFGRQGLLIGGNGGVPVANDAFNFIYQGIPRDSWQPDLVVINQGTNDMAANPATFRAAYQTFLATVRVGYPAAKIAALRPFGGFLATEIKAAVDARAAAGDARVFYIDTTGWLVAPADFTDTLHPNVQGSTKAAQALTAAITTGGLLP